MDDQVLIDPAGPIVRQIEACAPEVVLINLENPGRDLLEDFSPCRARSIGRSRCSSTSRMPKARWRRSMRGVGLCRRRVGEAADQAGARRRDPPVPGLSRLQAELAEARTALADRQVIDRAKAILMRRRGIDEPAAYALLRGHAMQSNRRIAEVAEAIVTSEALMGDLP